MLKGKEPLYISGNLERWSRTNIWTTFWTNIMCLKFNIYNNWTRILTFKLYSTKYNMYTHTPARGTETANLVKTWDVGLCIVITTLREEESWSKTWSS
jgi:hypothetical protein